MPYDLKSTPSGLPMQTVRSAARLTRTSTKTIYRRIEDGTLPAYRLGREFRISDEDLMRLYEPVNMEPTESQARITQLAKARKAQASYKALRAVQVAEDTPTGESGLKGGDTVHSDPVGDAATYNIDRPAVRVGSTGQHVIFDKLKREAGPFGVTDGVRELTYHNGRESEAWKREHSQAVRLG